VKRLLVALLTLWALAGPALALNPSEVLADPALESRARAISHQLRCLVCQNQSIDESDADLAADLRVLVRERLVAGDTDTQVLDYIVARYGEFVLLTPVFAWHTVALWIAGPAILIVGAIVIVVAIRRRPPAPGPATLSPAEQAALAELVGGPAPAAAAPGKSRRKRH